VSCPDWKTLAAWREDPRAEEPAEWQEALAHLDRGCTLCRRAALAADPTLIFRRLAALPERAAPAPAQEASEADAMRRAVAAMRAGSRVEASERRGRPLGSLRWKRWAAAAALAVAALSMPGDDARLHRDPLALSPLAARLMPSAMPAALLTGGPEGLMTGQASVLPSAGDDLPTLEGVDLPGARVYHMDGEGLAVTMIFSETLDV
jgi:hypothetical protein